MERNSPDPASDPISNVRLEYIGEKEVQSKGKPEKAVNQEDKMIGKAQNKGIKNAGKSGKGKK